MSRSIRLWAKVSLACRIDGSSAPPPIGRSFADFDLQKGHLDAKRGADNVGMARPAHLDRIHEAAWDQPIGRRRRREFAGRDPDDPTIGYPRAGILGFGSRHHGADTRQMCFALRHVGAHSLAGIKSFEGHAQRLCHHLEVAPLELKQRPVAQQVHVGGGGIQQDRLLGHPQRLACRRGARLGQAGPIGGLIVALERLRHCRIGRCHGEGTLGNELRGILRGTEQRLVEHVGRRRAAQRRHTEE
jgi:hypothetical protein